MNRPDYLKLNIEKTSNRQKKVTVEQFVHLLVPADMMTTKRGIMQKKPQHPSSTINPILETNCKRSTKGALQEKHQHKTSSTDSKTQSQ